MENQEATRKRWGGGTEIMCSKERCWPRKRLSLTLGFCLGGAAYFLAWFLPIAGMAQVSSNVPNFELAAPQPALTNPPIELPPIALPEASQPPRLSGTSQLAAPPVAGGLSPLALLQWGSVTFRPHFMYTLSFGNNLQSSPGQRENTLMNEIDPGILLQLGNHWTLDYTPALRYYSSSQFQDTLDHRVALTGGTAYRDWTFGLSQSYATSSQPLVETASQTDQETYATTLSVTYKMNTALSLELGANQSFQFVAQSVPGSQLSDWRSWSTLDWLNYQIEPKVGVALGVGFEYDDLSIGPNMTSERVQGRITWLVGNKLNVVLAGGVEDRQFLASVQPDSVTPIFSLSASYKLFEPTTLLLSAGRTVSPSYFSGQITENTSVSASVNQRLFGRLSLNVTGSYGKSTYQQSTAALSPSIASDYDSTSLNVSLSTVFLKRATAAIFFQQAYYSSSSATYNYSTTQEGLSLGYQF